MVCNGARLKLQRADKHISDANAAVAVLKNSYSSVIEVDPKTRTQSITYKCDNLIGHVNEIALITGDAIHNMRSALDHVWVALIESLGLPITRWTKFPFADSADALHKTLRDREIDCANPALFQKITVEIKPYKGACVSG